ncbi:putative nuclease HARBI1 [Folsomia candida]|uniref:Putative nuclease HARBI1 n=1 Tax=Folsomia candida TaxID=158441 RepID=A0A226DKC8_FOLCA|nr:putative nuclease HARBI1 [Folsomia candida]
MDVLFTQDYRPYCCRGLEEFTTNTQRKKRKQRKNYHVNPYLQLRSTKGRFFKDFEDMRSTPHVFQENYHMSPHHFDQLLNVIQHRLEPKISTRPNDAYDISNTRRHVASTYRISKQRLGPIIEQTCRAIFEELKGSFMKPPTKDEWIEIENEYNGLWNFPNTIGAIDGKHVAIKCPINAGSGYHNIVLMGLAAADYRFLFIDVGGYGSESDSQVFRSCELGRALYGELLDLPDDTTVFGKNMPYFFVADDAFPLVRRIMKPFCPSRKGVRLTDEQRIFNYRLSRARRCIENSFGILCARWACLARTLFMKPERAQVIVAACCTLHNFLIKKCTDIYSPPGFADYVDIDGIVVEGSWRIRVPDNSMFNTSITQQIQNPNVSVGNEIRNHLSAFVNSIQGSLDWQRSSVFLD